MLFPGGWLLCKDNRLQIAQMAHLMWVNDWKQTQRPCDVVDIKFGMTGDYFNDISIFAPGMFTMTGGGFNLKAGAILSLVRPRKSMYSMFFGKLINNSK